MSGKRLISFRGGDRSEYLAAYALSKFAFVNPAPRPEDFGVLDFLCVLTKQVGRSEYPESAFYIQVKSTKEPVTLDADAIKWITHHMDHPLLLCFVNKDESKLDFYSCSRLWFALFLRAEPASVTLTLDSDHPPEHHELTEAEGLPSSFVVHLGQSILSLTVAEIEKDPTLAYSVLAPWLRVDAANIARRRLGRIAVSCVEGWKTNEPPPPSRLNRYYFGDHFSDAERELVPILTALAHNYRHNRLRQKFNAVRELLGELAPLLDEHGLQFLDGRMTIDD